MTLCATQSDAAPHDGDALQGKHGMPTVRIDQRLMEFLPPIPDDRLKGLEADILANGCLAPLVVWNGTLVDGHHRYAICRKHDLPYEVREVGFESMDAALYWVWRHHKNRRNLSKFELAELALRFKPVVAEKAKERKAQARGGQRGEKKSSLPQNSAEEKSAAHRGNGETRNQLASEVGISHDTIAKAGYIAAHASEQTKKKLRAGDTTINKEYQKLKKAERRKQRKARKAARPPVADCPYRVFAADIATATRHVDAESVDWIITDPPYPKKHLGVYAHLAGFAAHALKPGGSLVAMVGQSYLPDILAKLTETLTYHWTLAYLTPGGQAAQLWARKVNTFWKPLLWLTKGKYDGGWIGDVCRSDVNHNDKRFHHWGQSESGMADIIDRLTDPGQVIVDPFLGAGTTGVVAIGMGRRFIGFDVDPDCTAMAEERLADAIEVSS